MNFAGEDQTLSGAEVELSGHQLMTSSSQTPEIVSILLFRLQFNLLSGLLLATDSRVAFSPLYFLRCHTLPGTSPADPSAVRPSQHPGAERIVEAHVTCMKLISEYSQYRS